MWKLGIVLYVQCWKTLLRKYIRCSKPFHCRSKLECSEKGFAFHSCSLFSAKHYQYNVSYVSRKVTIPMVNSWEGNLSKAWSCLSINKWHFLSQKQRFFFNLQSPSRLIIVSKKKWCLISETTPRHKTRTVAFFFFNASPLSLKRVISYSDFCYKVGWFVEYILHIGVSRSTSECHEDSRLKWMWQQWRYVLDLFKVIFQEEPSFLQDISIWQQKSFIVIMSSVSISFLFLLHM